MCTFKCVCMHVHLYACMCTSLMNQMYFLLCGERQMKARGKSPTPFPLSIFFAHRNNTCMWFMSICIYILDPLNNFISACFPEDFKHPFRGSSFTSASDVGGLAIALYGVMWAYSGWLVILIFIPCCDLLCLFFQGYFQLHNRRVKETRTVKI